MRGCENANPYFLSYTIWIRCCTLNMVNVANTADTYSLKVQASDYSKYSI